MLIIGVILEIQCDGCTNFCSVTRFNCVAFCAGALPQICFAFAKFECLHSHLFGNHKCGVKTNAKLTDNINVVLLVVFIFKVEGTAVGNCAKVFFQLFTAHTDAVVADGQCAVFLVSTDCDFKILAVQLYIAVGQGCKI